VVGARQGEQRHGNGGKTSEVRPDGRAKARAHRKKARDGGVATLETAAGRTAKTQNDQESTTSRPLRNVRGFEGRFPEETTPRGRDARKQVRPSGFIAHGTTVRAGKRRGGQFPATSRDSFREDQSSEG